MRRRRGGRSNMCLKHTEVPLEWVVERFEGGEILRRRRLFFMDQDTILVLQVGSKLFIPQPCVQLRELTGTQRVSPDCQQQRFLNVWEQGLKRIRTIASIDSGGHQATGETSRHSRNYCLRLRWCRWMVRQSVGGREWLLRQRVGRQ